MSEPLGKGILMGIGLGAVLPYIALVVFIFLS